MIALLLVAVVLALLVLRQNLLVILGVVTATLYGAYGGGRVTDIVVDVWDAANKDVLLSIPLYILAGTCTDLGLVGTCSFEKPVDPMTIGLPRAAQALMCAMLVSGKVKSISTSPPASAALRSSVILTPVAPIPAGPPASWPTAA